MKFYDALRANKYLKKIHSDNREISYFSLIILNCRVIAGYLLCTIFV